MSLISGNVIFGADAINCSSSSILGAAAFMDTASNQGTVSVASFSDTAVNEGTAVSAVFSDGAVNVGSLTSGTFLGTAVNSGVVTVAEFFGTASNVGVIVEAAKFADTSSNVGTVSGSAIFADFSVSDGVVEGAVQLGVNVTEGENQTLTETPTEYTQTNGFFPNAHYSGGVKAAPTNYATVVHQVGGFWYKYDGNGDGSLASDNYSDGTSMFTFVNGIKGAAYTSPYDPDGTFIRLSTIYVNISGNNYEVGSVDIVADGNGGERQGTPSYNQNGTFIVNVGGYNHYNDGAGGYYSHLVSGTFLRNDMVYINLNSSNFDIGNVDIFADGEGGEYEGTPSYNQSGNFITNFGGYNYYTDGAGSYYSEPEE